MQEAILNSIIEGPTDEIWPRFQAELPDLVPNYSKMILEETRDGTKGKLKEKLILVGLLPGLDSMSLEYKLEHYFDISKSRRNALIRSIYDNLTPEVIDKLDFRKIPIGKRILISIGDRMGDYGLSWYVMKKLGKNCAQPTLVDIENSKDPIKLIDLVYLASVGQIEERDIIHNLFKFSHQGFKYVVEYIKLKKNLTLNGVFDYFMSNEPLYREQSYFFPEFVEMGVPVEYMKNYANSHSIISTSNLRHYLVKTYEEDI